MALTVCCSVRVCEVYGAALLVQAGGGGAGRGGTWELQQASCLWSQGGALLLALAGACCLFPWLLAFFKQCMIHTSERDDVY